MGTGSSRTPQTMQPWPSSGGRAQDVGGEERVAPGGGTPLPAGPRPGGMGSARRWGGLAGGRSARGRPGRGSSARSRGSLVRGHARARRLRDLDLGTDLVPASVEDATRRRPAVVVVAGDEDVEAAAGLPAPGQDRGAARPGRWPAPGPGPGTRPRCRGPGSTADPSLRTRCAERGRGLQPRGQGHVDPMQRGFVVDLLDGCERAPPRRGDREGTRGTGASAARSGSSLEAQHARDVHGG